MSGVVVSLLALPALAGQPVSLRSDTYAAGPVTLGDLFDNAGAAASVRVGPTARLGLNVVLDAADVQRIARISGLDWDNTAGLRRIIVHGGAGSAPTAASSPGRPGQTAEVLTYTRSLATGEVVQPQDVAFATLSAYSVPADAPQDSEAVIGKAARRPLRAGSAVSAHDLSAPQVIKAGDIISVAYHNDGIELTLQARALQAAAVGDAFAVQNTASKKTIQAVASGPGQAVVGPEAERLKAIAVYNPAQLAALR